MDSYVERSPQPELADAVRTVWTQRTGPAPHVQRHLPTGGVELHVRIGGHTQLLGPLTGPMIEVIPPHTVVVGVRFWPGTPPPLPAPMDDLVDRRVTLDGRYTGSSEHVLMALQRHLLHEFRRAAHADPLMWETVRALMPGRSIAIDGLADRLGLSASQLRRRCLQAVGLSPKALQRTLRFQGFLALAQAGADGVADLAAQAGYADQPHLNRECLRLTGLTPRQLLGGPVDRCACGHDHSASYRPFLALCAFRSRQPA
ncbi:helix-turn-helix transcriptional regulator [Paractinoplanes atraurantiacus]|uniref:AraC-type DNA-binding protein n=1 Tax=Paractinoplanes atraurantiacus TaxID=1036182 RepID=A0A285K7Z0_9ACTN|nr:helix-turn-helix transcriptional regulator [Actinoplanes atraurantiacus]SNY68689.1 AraC-type DNA-binding protein [Actinoplanes atraurantiacus]